jgi:hypothetical protein
MRGEKLDEVNAELRRRWPTLPDDLISREVTVAYLAASTPYAYKDLSSEIEEHHRSLPENAAWLDMCPAEQIADAIDLDRYLAVELLVRLADLRRERVELDEVRAAFHALIQDLLSQSASHVVKRA